MNPLANPYVEARVSVGYLGTVLKYIGVAPAIPLGVALYYGESPVPFIAAMVAMIVSGLLLERFGVPGELGNREAFLLVSLVWFVVPVAGTVPYLVAGTGTIASPINALFESMSGFTTTGATVLAEISIRKHGHAMLLWRQLTQWLGGMGILVLMVAILPELSVGGAQVIDNEAPGLSLEKLTPRIQQTARALWGIYLGFTLLAALVFYGLHLANVAPNMNFYNAVAHALTTMPTGGFSPQARSIEAFSPAVQWAMIPFMIVAGTNFALFWYALTGDIGHLVRNAELRAYLVAMAGFGAVIVGILFAGAGMAGTPATVGPIASNLENALRHGVFQVVAVVTTTGYASMDVNAWDASAQTVLLFAYFLGGSAGSAAGSIKIVRWLVATKAIRRSLFTSIHPDAVKPIRLHRDVVDEESVRDVFAFVLFFVILFVVSTTFLYLDSLRTPGLSLSSLEAMSAAIATLGNVGPGFGVAGPMGSFLPFSPVSTLYMVFLMWIGRLEIISVLLVFTRAFWTR
ncbi:MAG: TrkH family potassium uptake protein [Halanaeroarchaeum sp.]